ncbi:nucleoside triphosphate pyrophosphohydrolase [Mesobacillus jeotgali]|uniref:nucleoside triphosphate pyrophosphohydrolase n=1 Tax=Mesobacillus jeotgali TaxID=129985 RepID=UPI0029CABB8D|nr:nucleoside triphosphate pyrophosphohydrolase [Mesobacillus jeotgali]
MASFTQEKFDLPGNLRGRSIHLNVIPTVSNLKNVIDKLIVVDGDVSQLKQWEKRSYAAYQISKIKREVMNAPTKERRTNLVKQHILNQDPNALGVSCIDIYLVAYVAENVKPGKQAFIEYVMQQGITDKPNSAQAIWQVGKGDGTYLGVLNEDGSVRDWDFFRKWINGLSIGKSKVYNKLVRDRIPEIIHQSGKSFNIRTLSHEEYIKELRNKAFEEMNEYAQSASNQEAAEELADLLEVMHSIAKVHGYTFDQIDEIRKRKAEERGGFRERIYLIDVEE